MKYSNSQTFSNIQGGVTLIETLVSVAIALSLFVGATKHFPKWQLSMRSHSLASKLESSYVASKLSGYKFVVYPSESGLRGEFLTSDERVMRKWQYRLDESIALEGKRMWCDVACFGGGFTLSNKSARCEVVFSRRGRARTECSMLSANA